MRADDVTRTSLVVVAIARHHFVVAWRHTLTRRLGGTQLHAAIGGLASQGHHTVRLLLTSARHHQRLTSLSVLLRAPPLAHALAQWTVLDDAVEDGDEKSDADDAGNNDSNDDEELTSRG